jgi:hypothetical protein
MKKLREVLANKLANAAADIAENSVDHCNPQGKEAIRKLVKNRTDQLLDPADKKNIIPSDPNEPLVFRSDQEDEPFKIEVKNLGSVWDEILKRKTIDESVINKAEIRIAWKMKF